MRDGTAGRIRERSSYLLLVALLLVADRISKSWVVGALDPGDRRVVLESFLDLIHLRNTGVAFGLFSGVESSAKIVVLSAVAATAAVVVIVYSMRTAASQALVQTALALILAGALGNLYDRLTYGYVVDFVYLHVGDFYWPAFNVADSAITCGVGLFGIDLVRDEIRDRR
jgi:signal peptidase II